MKNRLFDLRLRHGYTQGAVAERLGVTQPGYALIESSEPGNMKLVHFVRLCALYQIPPDDLIEELLGDV